MSPPGAGKPSVTLDGITSRAELHFHLLPAVDDGPEDMAETVELARMAVADGTGLVCTTPHVRELLRQDALESVPARVETVRAALRRAGVPLEVLPGAELAHDDLPWMDDRRLEAIAQGPPGRRWVLIEAPLFDGDAAAFLEGTAEVRARGFGTLIGHPERCRPLMLDDGAIEGELRAGARLQVNASSLLARHGARARAGAVELVRAGARPRARLGRAPPEPWARPGRRGRRARRRGPRGPRHRGAHRAQPARAAGRRPRRRAAHRPRRLTARTRDGLTAPLRVEPDLALLGGGAVARVDDACELRRPGAVRVARSPERTVSTNSPPRRDAPRPGGAVSRVSAGTPASSVKMRSEPLGSMSRTISSAPPSVP